MAGIGLFEDYRQRDKWLAETLKEGPTTISQLVRLGVFTNRQTSSLRLSKLRKRKRVKVIGTVQFHEGRPLDVYYIGSLKIDWLYHETRLSEFLLRVADRCARGNDVDQRLLPDATAWIKGRELHVELDTGEVPYSRVLKRYDDYALQQSDVLWIAPTESRMEGLRRRAEAISDIAMFTTYEKCRTEWTTFQGDGIRVG